MFDKPTFFRKVPRMSRNSGECPPEVTGIPPMPQTHQKISDTRRSNTKKEGRLTLWRFSFISAICPSARRPGQLALSEDVKMQVLHGLKSIRTVVADYPVAEMCIRDSIYYDVLAEAAIGYER